MNQHCASGAKARMRSCVACRGKSSPAELVRWVLTESGGVLPDLAQGQFGRGAWLHPSAACFKKAQGGFSRSFKQPVNSSPAELAELLGSAAERRVLALLGAARRARKLAVGRSAVESEIQAGRCHLLLVATDARSAARASEVQRVVASGGALGWGTKTLLGGLTGRTEAGLLAVTDDGLANAVKATIAMAQSARSAVTGTGERSEAARQRDSQRKAQTECSTEVG